MLLDLISTNFGVSPSGSQFKAYLSGDLVILYGRMTVWPSNSMYKGVHTLEINCAPLPMTKSLPTTVTVHANDFDDRCITVSRAWIKNGNTICVKPVHEYDEYQYYTIEFASAFVAPNKSFTPNFPAATPLTLTYTQGDMEGVECFLVEEQDWIMLFLKADKVNFSPHTGYMRAQLSNWHQGLFVDSRAIYNEDLYREKGSRFYAVSISGDGLMAISKDDKHTEDENASPKFFRVFAPK